MRYSPQWVEGTKRGWEKAEAKAVGKARSEELGV